MSVFKDFVEMVQIEDTQRMPVLLERSGDLESALVFVEQKFDTIEDWISFIEDIYSYTLSMMGKKNFQNWLQRDIFLNPVFHNISVNSDGYVVYHNPITKESIDVSDKVSNIFSRINRKHFLNIPTNSGVAQGAMYDLVNNPNQFEKKYLSSSSLTAEDVLGEFLRPIVIDQFSGLTDDYYKRYRKELLTLYGSDRGLIRIASFKVIQFWRLIEAGQFPRDMRKVADALSAIHEVLLSDHSALKGKVNQEGIRQLGHLVSKARAMSLAT